MKCRLRHFVTANVPTRSPLAGQPLGDDTGFNSPPQPICVEKERTHLPMCPLFLVEVIHPQRYHSPSKMTVLDRTGVILGTPRKAIGHFCALTVDDWLGNTSSCSNRSKK